MKSFLIGWMREVQLMQCVSTLRRHLMIEVPHRRLLAQVRACGILFFLYIHCRGSYESEHTTHNKGGMRQEGREWEGQKQLGTETLGDLWKGERWGREDGV